MKNIIYKLNTGIGSGIVVFIAMMIVLLASVNSFAQDKSVSGHVFDETGEGLPGVYVIVKGTANGTTTDTQGDFKLSIPQSANILVFSYVGYESHEVVIGDVFTFNIEMDPDITSLDEIVVTGYGQTQNKMLISTSVQSVKAEQLVKDRPVMRLEQALRGVSPAVVVLQESGSPGAPLTIRMRGVGTAGDATPLTLLNGFQVPDMNFINPNDISGAQIYKDAASSAIYGARGGNGVFNLQSKEGNSDQLIGGSFSMYYGVQSLANKGDYLTGQEYAQYYNDSYTWLARHASTVGARAPFSDDEISRLPNTTWIEEVSQDAPIQDYHLSLYGGKNNTNYYISGGWLDQQGIIGQTDFSRRSVNATVNTKAFDKLEIKLLGNYSNNGRLFIAENSENSRLMSAVSSLPGIYPVYAESGSPFNNGRQGNTSYNGVDLFSIAEFGNPMIGLTHTRNEAITNTMFGSGLLGYELNENFKLNTSYGYLSRNTDIKTFAETFDYPDEQYTSTVNYLSENRYEEIYWQWEGYLGYNKKFGDHTIDAVIGMSLLNNESSFSGMNAVNLSVNSFDEASFEHVLDPDQDQNTFIPSGQKNTTMSYYGRANYNFREKYVFGITLRADGSSKFGPENKWGMFPSFDAAWVISNESFLQNASFFDLLKLRASWGVNGNDRIAPYQYADRYLLQGSVGSEQAQLQDYNPDVKWEEITQTDIGIDMDLFGNKVGITLDYYIKETADMLIPFPNPGYTGLPDPVRNAATVKNTGFETIVMYRESIKDFKIDFGFNVGFNTNEITALNGGLPLTGANTRVFRDAPDLSYADVGDPIASFYGYTLESLDAEGNPVYKDISGPDGTPDGIINQEYDRTIIGNPYPNMIFGINLSLKYKGFELFSQASGTEGNDVVNASQGYGFAYSNRPTKVLGAWSLENPSSEVMRPSATEATNHEFSDYYIEDGSYFRFKNITLGYSFPKTILEKLKLEKLRIYISGNNLITFTKYSGYDPEIGANNDPRDVGIDRGFYPQAKSIIGGLQLSF